MPFIEPSPVECLTAGWAKVKIDRIACQYKARGTKQGGFLFPETGHVIPVAPLIQYESNVQRNLKYMYCSSYSSLL